MAVFPETMDKIKANDTENSIKIIDSYIRYMGERIEFAWSGLTRTMSASDISTTQLYIMLVALQNTVSTIASSLNGLQAEVNTLTSTTIPNMQDDIEELQENLSSLSTRVGTLESGITALTSRVSALEGNVTTINTTLTNHEQRITALEAKE